MNAHPNGITSQVMSLPTTLHTASHHFHSAVVDDFGDHGLIEVLDQSGSTDSSAVTLGIGEQQGLHVSQDLSGQYPETFEIPEAVQLC